MTQPKEEKPLPKSEWGEGPWQNEPDRYEWEHLGFPCLMVRNSYFGHWCGYVGVPPTHPKYEKEYDSIKDINVHGELTFADHCHGNICHKPKPGQPDNVWWLGFDCGHMFDLKPAMSSLLKDINHERYRFILKDVYRDFAYVKKEVEHLAKQLASK